MDFRFSFTFVAIYKFASSKFWKEWGVIVRTRWLERMSKIKIGEGSDYMVLSSTLFHTVNSVLTTLNFSSRISL